MITAELFGTKIDFEDVATVHSQLETYLSQEQLHHIVTPNTEMVMRARHDSDFRNILNQADLRLPDGIGLVWAARWLFGSKKLERVTGVDIANWLLDWAARHKRPVVLIGNKSGLDPNAAQEAALKLTERYPELTITGHSLSAQDPPPPELLVPQPAIVLVGFGAPAQDLWIHQYAQKLDGVKIIMGSGATIDFAAGVQKRAPRWMQKLGLEWLWRLIRQPSRIGRQLAIPHFMWLVLLIKLGLIKNHPLR